MSDSLTQGTETELTSDAPPTYSEVVGSNWTASDHDNSSTQPHHQATIVPEQQQTVAPSSSTIQSSSRVTYELRTSSSAPASVVIRTPPTREYHGPYRNYRTYPGEYRETTNPKTLIRCLIFFAIIAFFVGTPLSLLCFGPSIYLCKKVQSHAII